MFRGLKRGGAKKSHPYVQEKAYSIKGGFYFYCVCLHPPYDTPPFFFQPGLLLLFFVKVSLARIWFSKKNVLSHISPFGFTVHTSLII